MARPIQKLSAIKLDKLTKRAGQYSDGGGLYLKSDGKAQCSWLFRYALDGKAHWMGLGSYPLVSLADARNDAEAARKLLCQRKDPLLHRDAILAAERLEAAKAITFKQCAEKLIATKRAEWKSEKHAQQWPQTLAAYAYPVLGDLPVQKIDVGLVLQALEPIWTTKPETASRLRGRIQSVLDYANAMEWRSGDNPARWRGHLDKLLGHPTKIHTVKHHPALPYLDLPAFMEKLRAFDGVGARALEFLILTGVRSEAVRYARWSNVNLTDRTWTVPVEQNRKQRQNVEHRVPLSERAIEILEAMPNRDGYIFHARRLTMPLYDAAMRKVLRAMGFGPGMLTAHGFRATFKTWATERTNFQREVIEAALAHIVGGKVEQAYQRGDLFEKRRKLMDTWADYCAAPQPTANVVPLPLHASRAG